MVSREATKQETKIYFKDFDISNCFGVSLSLEQYANNKSIDNISSSQNLKHFLNVLNNRCFGNAFKRFNKKLRVISVLERSKVGRWHYHLTLQNPFPDDPYKFESMINHAWHNTNYGDKRVHFHRNINEGWNDYITKFNTSDDEVDWLNYNP